MDEHNKIYASVLDLGFVSSVCSSHLFGWWGVVGAFLLGCKIWILFMIVGIECWIMTRYFTWNTHIGSHAANWTNWTWTHLVSFSAEHWTNGWAGDSVLIRGS